jgi:hypothetical protein
MLVICSTKTREKKEKRGGKSFEKFVCGTYPSHHESLKTRTNNFDKWRIEWIQVNHERDFQFDVVLHNPKKKKKQLRKKNGPKKKKKKEMEEEVAYISKGFGHLVEVLGDG